MFTDFPIFCNLDRNLQFSSLTSWPDVKLIPQTNEQTNSPNNIKVFSLMAIQSVTPFLIITLIFVLQGHSGAASTVSRWKDPVTETVFDGFPYSEWREGSQPVIHIMPALQI